MTFFKQRTRSKIDNNKEFAAKRLPAHPVSRYHTFSAVWKATRKIDGHLPRPKNNNDLFPCCRTCQIIARPEAANEPLWRKKANVDWLRAEWFWDFGHLLPSGFIDYGVGVTPPVLKPERDRIFVFNQTDAEAKRHYLDIDMEEHAKAGKIQHEAKVRISDYPYSELVSFEGQLLCSSDGELLIAVPRDTWWTDGKEIWQRFIFKSPTLPYELDNLVLRDDHIKTEEGKVLFMGVQL
jgi:hypothetical protein